MEVNNSIIYKFYKNTLFCKIYLSCWCNHSIKTLQYKYGLRLILRYYRLENLYEYIKLYL